MSESKKKHTAQRPKLKRVEMPLWQSPLHPYHILESNFDELNGDELEALLERYGFVEVEDEAGRRSLLTRDTSAVSDGETRNRREQVIVPILEKRNMSRRDWATAAGVDLKTALGYLKGTKTYPHTRRKLAKALDLVPSKLPK